MVDFGQGQIKIREDFDKNDDNAHILTIFECFANRDRFLILTTLKIKDRCVCELEGILDKSQSGVSHHLKILEDAKLIQGWKKGKFTHYSLIKSTFTSFQEIYLKWANYTTNWLENIHNS